MSNRENIKKVFSIKGILLYIAAIIYSCLILDSLNFMKDIIAAFQKDWKVSLWLIPIIGFFLVPFIFTVNTIGTASCNLICGAVLCVFINIITREGRDIQHDKNNVENLSKIYIQLQELKNKLRQGRVLFESDFRTIDEIVDSGLSHSEYKTELSTYIQELRNKNDINRLAILTSSLVNSGYTATASTSGLTEYNTVQPPQY